ncbi:H-NS histone family protein [Acidovorax sp. NCPPB 4044]|uniref:H-NS histone family protein n=1 Tax=Acidovorax sp. NCPPB 4044 TaxID=2940490 RepID=UPI002303E1FB|nr:H-NS histone family protein [Acidovorax sp. NCPPB 4044]MDA8522931.1 H-NS histone family protein [Acidovorax sp. NCPPB 4044]
MSENTARGDNLLDGVNWLLSPKGRKAFAERLRGTFRVNFDREDPGRAWITLPDETVVHGRLSEDAQFVPDRAEDLSKINFLNRPPKPMKSLKSLLAEQEALDAEIAKQKKQVSAEALAQIHALIAEFGFTAQQVFPWRPVAKKVTAKYLNPQTGATWTGTGKPPAWIADKDREQFLIEKPLKKEPQGGPIPRGDGCSSGTSQGPLTK